MNLNYNMWVSVPSKRPSYCRSKKQKNMMPVTQICYNGRKFLVWYGSGRFP